MDELIKWIEDRINFYDMKKNNRLDNEPQKAYEDGICNGLIMALQFIKENYAPPQISLCGYYPPISNCCFYHTAAGGSCEDVESKIDPSLLKCTKCEVPEDEECKVCQHTSCNHYWVKMTPLNAENQKYLCLNCDKVK